MGRLILRLLGVAAIVGGLVLLEVALADLIDLPSCSDVLSRGTQRHTTCAPGTSEAILRIVGAALLFFIGLVLDALGRGASVGVGVVLPLAFAGLVAAIVVALWPDHKAVAILVVVPGALLAAIVGMVLRRSRRIVREGALLLGRVESIARASGGTSDSRSLTGARQYVLHVAITPPGEESQTVKLTQDYKDDTHPARGDTIAVRWLDGRARIDPRAAATAD